MKVRIPNESTYHGVDRNGKEEFRMKVHITLSRSRYKWKGRIPNESTYHGVDRNGKEEF